LKDMGKTKIEWCDETVNFITGCRNNCAYCYARGTAERNARMGVERYMAVKSITGHAFSPAYHDNVMRKERERLSRVTRPRVIFIGSMSDPATEGRWLYLDGTERGKGRVAGDSWVQDMISDFCRNLPQHRFILLTKKPQNLINDWPPNVWIGVSVADHAGARYRIPMLLTDRQTTVLESDPVLRCGGLLISAEPLQGGPDPGDFVDPDWLNGVAVKPGWLIIGSQTRPALPPDKVPHVVENGRQLVAWAAENEVPCFTKHNMVQLAPEMSWPMEFPEDIKQVKKPNKEV